MTVRELMAKLSTRNPNHQVRIGVWKQDDRGVGLDAAHQEPKIIEGATDVSDYNGWVNIYGGDIPPHLKSNATPE